MVEKWTRGDICHLVAIYARINTLYVTNYHKGKDPSYLAYLQKIVYMIRQRLKYFL